VYAKVDPLHVQQWNPSIKMEHERRVIRSPCQRKNTERKE